MGRFWQLSVLSVCLILSDQLFKGAIQSTFFLGEQLPLVKNTFYLTNERSLFLLIGQNIYNLMLIIFLISLFAFLIKFLKKNFLLVIAIVLVSSGLFSNLLDSLTHDYISLFFMLRIASFKLKFNLAHTFITSGFLLALIDYLQKKKTHVARSF